MKLLAHGTLVLAVVVLGLAAYEFLHPSAAFRIGPVPLLLLALLLVVRYLARRQAQKRQELLKSVPPRPLGLSGEAPDDK
jgi:uncharacterized membrane protein